MSNGLVVRRGEPTTVVLVSQNIARVHGTQKDGSSGHLPLPITTHHGHTSWVACAPFADRVLTKMAYGLVVRQGEPTIVVLVSQNIARFQGTQKDGSSGHLSLPITTHHGHTS